MRITQRPRRAWLARPTWNWKTRPTRRKDSVGFEVYAQVYGWTLGQPHPIRAPERWRLA